MSLYKDKEGYTPYFWRFQVIDGKIYFWDMRHNALFSMKDGIAEEEPLRCTASRLLSFDGRLSYSNIYLWKKKLLLLPYFEEDILIYSVPDKKEIHIPLPVKINDMTLQTKTISLLVDAIIADGKAFLVGGRVPYILKINMETNLIEDYVNIFPEEKNEKFFFRGIDIIGDMVLVTEPEGNRVLRLNKNDIHQFDFVTIPFIKKGITDLVVCDRNVFLIPRYNEPIVLWDYYENKFIPLSKFPEKFSFGCKGNRELDYPILMGDRMYLFPADASNVVYYDIMKNEIKIDKVLSDVINNETAGKYQAGFSKCVLSKRVRDSIVVLCGDSDKLFVYDIRKQGVQTKQISFDVKEYNKYMSEKLRKNIQDNNIIIENDEMSLEFFLTDIV